MFDLNDWHHQYSWSTTRRQFERYPRWTNTASLRSDLFIDWLIDLMIKYYCFNNNQSNCLGSTHLFTWKCSKTMCFPHVSHISHGFSMQTRGQNHTRKTNKGAHEFFTCEILCCFFFPVWDFSCPLCESCHMIIEPFLVHKMSCPSFTSQSKTFVWKLWHLELCHAHVQHVCPGPHHQNYS